MDLREEYVQKLNTKLQEEAKEFIESDSIDEIADILEVIDAIRNDRKFNRKELLRIKKDKKRERGGFEKKIILDES